MAPPVSDGKVQLVNYVDGDPFVKVPGPIQIAVEGLTEDGIKHIKSLRSDAWNLVTSGVTPVEIATMPVTGG